MLDLEFNIDPNYQATLVSIVSPSFPEHKTEIESTRSMTELRELLRTLDIKTASAHIQTKKEIDTGTILGSRKTKETQEIAKEEAVFDFGKYPA